MVTVPWTLGSKLLVRIGEAQNPGPQQKSGKKLGSCKHLVCRSQNISSWHRHGEAILELASEDDVHILCLQETNLTAGSIPSASQLAASKGWQGLFVPKPSVHNGGIAVLVRKPLGLLQLRKGGTEEGQFATAQLLGSTSQLQVTSLYSNPAASLELLFEEAHRCDALRGAPWLLGLDGNTAQLHGPWAEAMRSAGGVLRAVARHNTSATPIDGIWTAEQCQTFNEQELQSCTDHTIAHCCLNIWVPGSKPEFRFSKTPKVCQEAHPAQVSWQDCASQDKVWLEALQDLESAWTLWCSDAQKWLSEAGVLSSGACERPLGALPTLRSGNHKLSFRQSIAERQLRRLIRRLREAQKLQHLGRPVPATLAKALLRSPACDRPGDRNDIRQARYGAAALRAQQRLQSLLTEAQRKALSDWRTRVHTFEGACRWLRKEEAIPTVLQNEEGKILCQPAEAAKALSSFWANTFGCHAPTPSEAPFWDFYGQFLQAPSVSFPVLSPITGTDLRKVARKNHNKAAGPDGISPSMCALLPDEALSRLAAFLNECESQGKFPSQMKQWKMTFLPKKRDTAIAGLGDVRPVAIGCSVYRMWASLRLQSLGPALSSCLCTHQCGGVVGPDASTLVTAFQLEFPESEWAHCAFLDYAKAFDSTDVSLCLGLLSRIGTPPAVVNLLRDQWGSHARWVAFAGAVHESPLLHCKGLPQGDPFAPVCMSLLLSLPARHASSLAPHSCSLLYLDDRSLLARSAPQLQLALGAWNTFEQFTRLRTHQRKSQFVGRTPEALASLLALGFPAKATGSMLGITVGARVNEPSEDETLRLAKAKVMADRLALLPLSLAFKARLAAAVVAPKAIWGTIICGRHFLPSEATSFRAAFRRAVKGSDAGYDRSSRALQQVLLLGHTSEINLLGAQHAMSTLARWAKQVTSRGLDPTAFDLGAVGRALGSAVSKWGWQPRPRRWGCWGLGRDCYDILAPSNARNAAAHALRVTWRVARIKEWLRSNSRRDSAVARSANVRATPALAERLCKLARAVSGDAVAVMCGGMSTDARWAPTGAVRHVCHDCRTPCVPSVEHVLWECSHPAYVALRTRTKPHSALRSRLGWSPNALPFNEEVALISMLGGMRNTEVSLRRHRPSWRGWRGWGEGRGLPPEHPAWQGR